MSLLALSTKIVTCDCREVGCTDAYLKTVDSTNKYKIKCIKHQIKQNFDKYKNIVQAEESEVLSSRLLGCELARVQYDVAEWKENIVAIIEHDNKSSVIYGQILQDKNLKFL